MSLIIRRKANGPGVDILEGKMKVRVSQVDPDGTVHLVFNGDRSIDVIREELLSNDQKRERYNNVQYK